MTRKLAFVGAGALGGYVRAAYGCCSPSAPRDALHPIKGSEQFSGNK
jgi:hypothetical protein